MQKLEQMLELVYTTKNTYLGLVQGDDMYLHLSKAAIIPSDFSSPKDIALAYFSEKARRNLKSYDLPLGQVEMKTVDAQVNRMYNALEELSKVANRSGLGKYKINRLKKFLGDMK